MYQKKLIAGNLKKYVRKSGKSARRICKDLNIPYFKYQEWISENSVHMPRMETLTAFANYFGIRTVEFFHEETEPSPLDKENQRLLKSIQEMEQQAINTKKPVSKKIVPVAIASLLAVIIIFVCMNLW